MSTLYEITDLIERTIAEGVDRETGEISEELAGRLDELEIERTEKIRNIMLYLKGEDAEVAKIQHVIDGLKRRQAVHKAHVAWLERYLEKHTNEDDDVKDPRGRVYYKESPGRVEFDAPEGTAFDHQWIKENVDPRFVKVMEQVTVDKAGAKKALKTGPVKGLKLMKPKLFTID